MKDLQANILAVVALFPKTINTGSGALNTGDIDLQGFHGAQVVVSIGDISETLSGSAKIDLKLQHADELANGTAGSYTDCTDDDVNGWTGLTTGIFKTIDADAKEKLTYAIGYRGGKRFIKATATPTGLTTGGIIGITVNKAVAEVRPVAQQA